MAQLSGKTARVSGGARGIGAAIAQAIVDNGGNVVIGDLLDDDGTALAERLGPTATYVHLDVTNPREWAAAVAAAVATHGQLDVLVNNAGIAPRPARRGREACRLPRERRLVVLDRRRVRGRRRRDCRRADRHQALLAEVG
jgi:NAD(P)-dependent dehydrogenase (short-subunit alcohol dehydrogenase family)